MAARLYHLQRFSWRLSARSCRAISPGMASIEHVAGSASRPLAPASVLSILSSDHHDGVTIRGVDISKRSQSCLATSTFFKALVRDRDPCSHGKRSTSGKAVFSYMLLGNGLNLFDRCCRVTVTPGQMCSALCVISRVCTWTTAISVELLML